jgi:hypothetical protein
MTGLVIAAAISGVGFIVTFAGRRLPARLVGLGLMGGGALLALASPGPRELVPRYNLVVTGVSLVGMLAVGVWLARRLTADHDQVSRSTDDAAGSPDGQRGTIDEGRT